MDEQLTYPMAEAIVDRLNISGRRRYGQFISRRFEGGDQEAVQELAGAAAHHVSGEFGLVFQSIVKMLMDRIDELEERKADRAGRKRRHAEQE